MDVHLACAESLEIVCYLAGGDEIFGAIKTHYLCLGCRAIWEENSQLFYNAFFMALPVSSFVFHSSLLTANSVNLVVAHSGFLCIMEIVHLFDSGYFNYFLNSSSFIPV